MIQIIPKLLVISPILKLWRCVYPRDPKQRVLIGVFGHASQTSV